MWSLTPMVRPHQLQFWKVAWTDWIEKDYIIKEVPYPHIVDAADIVYPDASTNVFWDEYLSSVLIQWQVSIYNRCQHFCPSCCLPLSFVAALWCHRCPLKINLHPRRYHYDSVKCSWVKSRWNVQSSVGNWVYYWMGCIVSCKSRNVETVQDAGGRFDTEWKDHGGFGRKKGYMYLSWRDFSVQLVRYANCDSYPALCWLINTKRPTMHFAQLPGNLRNEKPRDEI